MNIGIIGAGSVGGRLGAALAAAGHKVRFGTRNPEKVDVPGCDAGTVAEAVAFGEVLALAVPGRAALEAAGSLGEGARGKVLLDTTNPVGWDDGPTLAPTPAGSLAEGVAAASGARVVKAFSTFGAEWISAPQIGDQRMDTWLASDDAEAKALATGLAEDIGFAVVDCGPLRNAHLLEAAAVLWIHLATKGGRGRNVAFKLLAAG